MYIYIYTYTYTYTYHGCCFSRNGPCNVKTVKTVERETRNGRNGPGNCPKSGAGGGRRGAGEGAGGSGRGGARGGGGRGGGGARDGLVHDDEDPFWLGRVQVEVLSFTSASKRRDRENEMLVPWLISVLFIVYTSRCVRVILAQGPC